MKPSKKVFIGNYWDQLMATDEGAANYMETYGEGPGCDTRMVISKLLRNGQSVLDVGCGPGWNYDHFKKYGPKVDYKGLDYSMRFVRVASIRAGAPVFFLGDVRKIKEREESFDVVLLQDCLEHTNGYREPIKEALRVAREKVIITFWKASFMDGNESENQTNDDGDDGYGSTYNRAEFEEFLDSLGLRWETLTTNPGANRWHRYYVVYKGGK